MSLSENGALSAIPKFDCHSDPATLGPRWTHWLTSFELFVDGKGLIVTEATNATTRQRRRAMLLHFAGPDVQEILTTLADTGEASDYASSIGGMTRRNYSKWRPVGNSTQTGFWIRVYNAMHTT